MLRGFLGALLAFAFLVTLEAGADYVNAPNAPSSPKVERITYNSGGNVDTFFKDFGRKRVAGTRFIIDGSCISACTLVTGMAEPGNICATPNARLVFHSAFYMEDDEKVFAKDATEIIWHTYPVKLRELLRSKGWNGDQHDDLIFIEGNELNAIVRTCTSEDLARR